MQGAKWGVRGVGGVATVLFIPVKKGQKHSFAQNYGMLRTGVLKRDCCGKNRIDGHRDDKLQIVRREAFQAAFCNNTFYLKARKVFYKCSPPRLPDHPGR